jgi:hypothetical protein
VVATCPPRDRRDCDFSRSRRDDRSLAGGESLGRCRLAFGRATAELVDDAGEAAEVVVAERRRDVNPARRLGAAVDDPREGAHDDVADPLCLERLEDRVRVEWGLKPAELAQRAAFTTRMMIA